MFPLLFGAVTQLQRGGDLLRLSDVMLLCLGSKSMKSEKFPTDWEMRHESIKGWQVEYGKSGLYKLGFSCENHRTKYGTFQRAMFDYRGVFNERTLCSHEASSIIYYIRCPEIYESDASFYCSFLKSGKRGPRGNGHPERNPGAHPWTTKMMKLYTGKDEDQPLPNNPREDYCLFSSQ